MLPRGTPLDRGSRPQITSESKNEVIRYKSQFPSSLFILNVILGAMPGLRAPQYEILYGYPFPALPLRAMSTSSLINASQIAGHVYFTDKCISNSTVFDEQHIY